MENPALTALVNSFDAELVLAQIVILRRGSGFESRHLLDREKAPNELRLVGENDLRALAQFTEAGLFRPLKSAPNLRRGWRTELRDAAALGAALNHLYPGAMADWFVARESPPPITSYRAFTGRQTGMYRITTLLDDITAGAAIRACCHPDFCLKRRRWSVEGLAPDALAQKSLIPCLEPCAILLEFARKIARLEQEAESGAPKIETPDPTVAETDFNAPANPRRVRFVLEKRTGPAKPATG